MASSGRYREHLSTERNIDDRQTSEVPEINQDMSMLGQQFKRGAAVSVGRRQMDDRQEVRHARNQDFLRWTSEIEKRGSLERASVRCHVHQERVRLYARRHGIRFRISKLKILGSEAPTVDPTEAENIGCGACQSNRQTVCILVESRQAMYTLGWWPPAVYKE